MGACAALHTLPWYSSRRTCRLSGAEQSIRNTQQQERTIAAIFRFVFKVRCARALFYYARRQSGRGQFEHFRNLQGVVPRRVGECCDYRSTDARRKLVQFPLWLTLPLRTIMRDGSSPDCCSSSSPWARRSIFRPTTLQLPDVVASHFNGRGVANGWQSNRRSWLFVAMSVLAAAVGFGIHGLSPGCPQDRDFRPVVRELCRWIGSHSPAENH